jgi:hypothetical protein
MTSLLLYELDYDLINYQIFQQFCNLNICRNVIGVIIVISTASAQTPRLPIYLRYASIFGILSTPHVPTVRVTFPANSSHHTLKVSIMVYY